jgi:hypothetical protein
LRRGPAGARSCRLPRRWRAAIIIRKLRFVTKLVRRSFTRELRQQARAAGDVVHVRSFTCAIAYTTGRATYFTCHARVSIKARGERWSASGDDVDDWLLVVETRRSLGWLLETPDVCDNGSYAVCVGFARHGVRRVSHNRWPLGMPVRRRQ